MGTRVEYGINVLAASTKGSRFSVDESESQRLNPSFEITGFDKYRNSNKMAADKHNVDFIRNTMQLHDRIFKQQVKELHRLYSVQKLLMEEMKNNKKPEKRLREDEETTPTERSGSCSNEIRTIKLIKTTNTVAAGKGFDLEKTTDQEDVSTGVISRIEGNAVEDEEEAGIELTLSIGRRSTKKTEKLIQQQQEDSSTPTSTSSKKPHWLFHGLALNRTSSSSTG